MANLTETPTYDAGVYQLETTDPVQGGPSGVSNSPLKNLANRTAYLKQRVDGIEAGTTDLPGYAKLASPSFSGSPTAPTQALGDNTTKIANTAFVQGTVGGVLTKSVAGTGSVTLTAVEAGNAILVLNGILTGNRDVIVPRSPTRSWIVRNNTTGASTLTVKTAAGTGVVVTQGTTAFVWTDGTNVYDGLTDFDSPAMTGNPTAPTAAQFDNDTSLATTAFVQRALGNRQGYSVPATGSSFSAADAGKVFSLNGPSTYTLSSASGLPNGATFGFFAAGNGCVVKASGSDIIITKGGTTVTSLTLNSGDTLSLVRVGPTDWLAISGSAQLKFAEVFGSSLAANGYQKLPSGLIIQWGTSSSIAAGSSQTVAYPIAFPTSAVSASALPGVTAGTTNPNPAGIQLFGAPASNAQFLIRNMGITNSYQYTWFAIGF